MRIEYNTEEKELFIRMNNLRGYLALVVLLSHIWGYTGMLLLVPFNKGVTIAVTVFFFLSGYGMTRSYKRNEQYIKKLFAIKVPYLCFMAVLAYILSAMLEWGLTPLGIENPEYLPFGIQSFFSSTNWYVYELLGFYIIFAIVVKFVKERYQMPMIFTVSVVAFVILYNLGVVEAYYNSIIGFWLGMLCGRNDYIHTMNRHKHGYMYGICVLIISFMAMFVLNRESMLFAVVRNLAAVGAIIVMLYCIRYVDVKDKFSGYMSKISPEVYFYHMPLALLLSQVIENSILFAVSVTVITFLIAPVINRLNKWINTKISKAAGF